MYGGDNPADVLFGPFDQGCDTQANADCIYLSSPSHQSSSHLTPTTLVEMGDILATVDRLDILIILRTADRAAGKTAPPRPGNLADSASRAERSPEVL